jgi:hypothetical protein
MTIHSKVEHINKADARPLYGGEKTQLYQEEEEVQTGVYFQTSLGDNRYVL